MTTVRQVTDKYRKAAKKPKGEGWESAGKHGGMRREKEGGGYEYWYPKKLKHKDLNGKEHHLGVTESEEYDGTKSHVIHKDGKPLGKVYKKETYSRETQHYSSGFRKDPPWRYEAFDDKGNRGGRYDRGRHSTKKSAIDSLLSKHGHA